MPDLYTQPGKDTFTFMTSNNNDEVNQKHFLRYHRHNTYFENTTQCTYR